MPVYQVPQAPTWIKDRALAKWYELWGILERSRILPTTHGDLVAMYCQAYSDFRESIEMVASMGALVKDKSNRFVPNPYIEIRDTAMRQMTAIGKTLGLSPDNPMYPIFHLEDTAMLVDSNDDEPSGDAGTDDVPANAGRIEAEKALSQS